MENIKVEMESFYAELCKKYGKENVEWDYLPIIGDEENFEDEMCTCEDAPKNYDDCCKYCQSKMDGEQESIFILGDKKEICSFLIDKQVDFICRKDLVLIVKRTMFND